MNNTGHHMTDLRPYPEYRDSGLPWLGRLPQHWGTGPGFAAFREKEVKNTGMQEKTVLSLSYGRIVVKPPEKLHGLVPESFETYQVLDPGDIIIRSTDLQNDWNSLRVGLVRDHGIITSAYLCLKTTAALTPEFGYLLLHAFDLMKVFYGMGSGLRQNLSFSDFKRMLIFVPPPDEQAAIVRFLDHANRRVERFVLNRRRLIEVLTEQKQAIINRAVTRGLDPNVRLKPSGVEWLADIPEPWDCLPHRAVFEEIKEQGHIDEPLLSVTISKGIIRQSDLLVNSSKKDSSNLDKSKYKLVMPDDIAYNKMRAWQGAVGVSRYRGIVSPAYIVVRLRGANNADYFHFLFRTPGFAKEAERWSYGITSDMWSLRSEHFKMIYSCIPPRPEQDAIVCFLDEATADINKAIDRARREIALIREYRTRLIADVVTGKLDVRGLAPGGQLAGAEIVEDENQAVDIDDVEVLVGGEPELVEGAADGEE